MFQRSWVRIPAPYTGWTFFTYYCCKNFNVCLKRPKISEKEAGVGPFLKKQFHSYQKIKCPFVRWTVVFMNWQNNSETFLKANMQICLKHRLSSSPSTKVLHKRSMVGTLKILPQHLLLNNCAVIVWTRYLLGKVAQILLLFVSFRNCFAKQMTK